MDDLEKKTFSTQEGPRTPGGKPSTPDKEKPADPPKGTDDKR
jgi:hypothetical protein